jgi:hypothetical protein
VAIQVSALKVFGPYTWKIIDQRTDGDEGNWHVVSEFTVVEPCDVMVQMYRISAQGHMIADAIQLLPVRDGGE